MTLQDIETAIGQYLQGMSGAPDIAWPNKDFKPNGLYIEFRHTPNTVVDGTTNGGFEYHIGIALLTVVAPVNAFSGAANSLAQGIADRFPKALRLTAGTGKVLINAPTSFGTPFPDGAYWRQPVRISYITEG